MTPNELDDPLIFFFSPAVWPCPEIYHMKFATDTLMHLSLCVRGCVHVYMCGLYYKILKFQNYNKVDTRYSEYTSMRC